MIYFTADWHLGEDRIGINGKPNLFYRPFNMVSEQDHTINEEFCNSSFKDGDTLYHLGDVIYKAEESSIKVLNFIRKKFPNSKFILILGNYDTEDKMPFLTNFFNEIHHDYKLDYFQFGICYLNHYPTRTLDGIKDAKLGITGHIHSLWKVQKNLINVGVDAWNFRPISEKEIEFCYDAMNKHYDENVFPYNR